MSKRKRDRSGQSPDNQERPSKVRIREVQDGANAKSEGPQIKADKKARKLAKKQKKAMKKAEKSGYAIPASETQWEISDPAGGQMLDLDPIFSHNEEYLLLPYSNSVGVYATSTSLLQRKLITREFITSISLHPLDQTKVYVTTKSGIIERWDWANGKREDSWQISSTIFSASTTSKSDLLYTIDRKEQKQWIISSHRLIKGGHEAITNIHSLLKQDKPLSNMKALDEGKIIVVTSQKQLIIGVTKDPSPQELKHLEYKWRIIDCPEWIVCLDVRTRSRMAKKKHSPFDAIDVVIGGAQGSIYIYEDLLPSLLQMEQNQGRPSPRRLHWHRNAVLSVKWSLDGNYIISGGQETVLVLWQLETGHQQDLPHLGAPIESIVVSPSGTSYAVRLADNSAMVLSTTELQPTFSVAGMHVPVEINPRHLPLIPTVDKPQDAVRLTYPATSHKDRLLFAVPASRTSLSHQSQSAPYLQICDFSGSQISRQALTRTKITSLNMGPESNTIEEPNVTLMQVSGNWLATFEEWSPPSRDFDAFSYDTERSIEIQISRREPRLKFWSWNEENQVWELNTRFDNPHLSDQTNRILALVADPSEPGFSTIDEEGIVKIWHPKSRKRNGLIAKGKSGYPLSSWQCAYTVALGDPLRGPMTQAKLAISLDGSTLAAAQAGPVHLIDAFTGKIKDHPLTNLAIGPIHSLAFSGRYLLILSKNLVAFDLINLTVQLNENLRFDPHPGLGSSPFLCTSHPQQSDRFVIAVPIPRPPKHGKGWTNVFIFSTSSMQRLFSKPIAGIVTDIIPAIGVKRGWYLLNSSAEIRTLTPRVSHLPVIPTSALYQEDEEKRDDRVFVGLDNVFGRITLNQMNGDMQAEELTKSPQKQRHLKMRDEEEDEEEDKRVVKREQLAEIFDSGGNRSVLAMPPVGELFEQVAKLVNGRKKG